MEKVAAVINNGCLSFDSAMMGFGGCPMAKDELTGNIATEVVLDYAEKQGLQTNINRQEFQKARSIAQEIFSQYH